jgi:hypothetical protein
LNEYHAAGRQKLMIGYLGVAIAICSSRPLIGSSTIRRPVPNEYFSDAKSHSHLAYSAILCNASRS